MLRRRTKQRREAGRAREGAAVLIGVLREGLKPDWEPCEVGEEVVCDAGHFLLP